MEENILVKVGADISNFSRNINKATKELSGISSGLDKATKNQKSFVRSIGEIATGIGLHKAVAKAIGAVTSSLDGAISRYDTLNNFPRVLQQIGFSAQDSKRAINRLSDGIQGLPTTLDDVAKTAQRIAVMTGDLNGAVETTLALNNAFISSGSSAADTSRGLEQYVQMLAKGEVDLQSWRTLQETMGVALNDVAKAFGFAGRSAQNDLYDALKNGKITFDEFNKKIIELSNQTGGFAERALTASGGIKTAWTNMKTAIVRGTTNIISAIDSVLADTQLRSVENIITKMGKGFFSALDGIAKAIPVVADGIRDLIKAIEPWREQIKAATALLVGLSVGFATFKFATYATGFLSITKALKVLKSGLETVALSSMLLWDTLRKNPLITIISVIAGLAAGFAYLYKTSEPFRQTIDKIGETLKGVFLSTLTKIKSTLAGLNSTLLSFKQSLSEIVRTKIVPFFQGLSISFGGTWLAGAEKASSVFRKLKDVFVELTKIKLSPIFDAVTKAFQGDFSEVAQMFGNLVPTIIGFLVGGIPALILTGAKFLPAIAEGIQQNLPALLSGITAVVDGIITAITTYLPIFVQAGVDVLTKLIEGLTNAIPIILPAILMIVTTLITTIAKFFPQFVQAGVTVLTNLLNGIVNALPLIVGAILTLVTTILGVITENLPLIITAGITILTALIEGIITLLPAIIDAVLSIILTIAQAVIDNLPKIIDAGIKILDALINGIISILPQLIDAGIMLIFALFDALIDNLPKIIDAGVKILVALIDGIMKILPQLLLAGLTLIVKLAAALIQNLPKILEAGGKILLALLEGIAKLIPKLLSLGWDLVKKLAGAIGDKVGDMFNVGANLIKGLWNGINSVKDWIIEKIGGFASGVVKAVKGFFGVHSPSKVFRDEIGRYLPLGLVAGITDMKSDVIAAARNLTEWATPEPPDISLAYATPGGVYGTLRSAVSGSVDVNTNEDRLVQAVNSLERKLSNLTVEMDGKTVGYIVEPHITQVQQQNTVRMLRSKGMTT